MYHNYLGGVVGGGGRGEEVVRKEKKSNDKQVNQKFSKDGIS